MQYGSGDFVYEWVPDWGLEAKNRWPITEVAGVTVSQQDTVYLLTRTLPPVVVFDREGNVLDDWGEDIFVRPHGMYIDKEGFIYGVDDGGHAVYKFNAAHELILTLGTKHQPSDTGCVAKDYRTITQSAGPFHAPTRLIAGDDGCLYVSDGYGNARVHKFLSDGTLLKSWGEPGDKDGQFALPHGIGLANGILYVADRENNRVQLFTTEGEFVDAWTGLHRPADIWIDQNNIVYVTECKHTSAFDASPSRVSIFNLEGKLLARMDTKGGYAQTLGSRCAHGVAVDSRGDVYIAEVAKEADKTFYGIKKYRRV